MDPLAEIETLYIRRGNLEYGEAVSQLEHGLQGAMLADRRGEGPAMITAALLHDIGHLLHEDAAAAMATGDDDAHEALGVHYLARWFGRDVLAPIALHVEAKRFLAATEPGYFEQLSPVSKRTLEIQRGPMSRSEAAAFESNPHSRAAIRLRRIDEAAKVFGQRTPPLSHYLAVAAMCLRDRRMK
jgi:phosphonate degradation associated HDIG domain protein